MTGARRLLAAGLALLAWGTGVPPGGAVVTDPATRGAAAWKAGRFTDAVRAWRVVLAGQSNGVAEAAFGLGLAAQTGRGMARDPHRAIGYFRIAAARGSAAATERLGLLLSAQPDRKEEAIRLLDRAARMGRPVPQYLMGLAYADGDQVAVDLPLASAFLQRAVAGGVGDARPALRQLSQRMTATQRQRALLLGRTLSGRVPGSGRAPGRAGPRALATAEVRAASRRAPGSTVPNSTAPTSTIAKPPMPAANRAASPWVIQLSASTDASMLRTHWGRLTQIVPALRRKTPSYESFGSFTRLRVHRWPDRAAAESVCREVARHHETCVILADRR
ncbi:hypothetical protein [Sphingomonas sp.]|jgi:hypothetical protein|uniref:SPOR domain-containing protein n=1 Tax=Sphingomonas sp. TaxID=28214 RepID=UPI0035C7B47E